MKIITTKYNKRKKYQDIFTAFHVSAPVLNFLKMYSVANEMTLSSLLRGIVIKWISDNNLTEAKLENEILNNIQKQWNKKQYSMNFEDFCIITKKELNKKGIDNNIIKRIKQ
jgi:hypothetical protein